MGIIHPSLVSSQQSVQSYHSGIMDGRHQGKVYWLPRLFFSPTHCSACICFALLRLGACLQACFLFFLTVSDSPISELQALQEHTC